MAQDDNETVPLTTSPDKPVVEPTRAKSLLELLANLTPIEEDFPAISDPPPDPVELSG
jgi:hypothetical protein